MVPCRLSDYNFYILPLGFSYPFQTIATADLRKEPEDIAQIIRDVSRAQEEGRDKEGEFFLVCEITTTLVSAKKLTGDSDLVAAISEAGGTAVVVSKEVNLLDSITKFGGASESRHQGLSSISSTT